MVTIVTIRIQKMEIKESRFEIGLKMQHAERQNFTI